MEDYLDDLYLLFSGGGSFFLLPLCCVKQVRERTPGQTVTEEFSFSRRLHKDGLTEKYHVLLGLDGKELCLAAEEVLGIESLDKYRFTILEEPVLNERNRYLKAVIQNWSEAYFFDAAFLLEPSFLYSEMAKMEAENEMADS